MIRRVIAALVLQSCVVMSAWASCVSVGDPPEEICADVYPTQNPTVVELGQSITIPMHYANNTGTPITYQTVVEGNVIFPGVHTINVVTLDPHTEMTFPPLVIPTDGSMPIGTDHIVIGWGAVGGSYNVSAQATFEIVLTVPQVLQNVIQLPVRWCVVEGTPAAQGHHAGELMDGASVFKLLQRSNDMVWTSQAQILFRNVIADGIPVICDPDPPPTGKGKLGDITEDGGGSSIVGPGNACERAWERIAPNQPGRILVGARAFQDFARTMGVTPAPLGSTFIDATCKHPRTVTPLQEKSLETSVLVDEAIYGTENYPMPESALVLAHELGHQLFLGHGNGLDDNHDGGQPPTVGPRRYDEFCEPLCHVAGLPCSNEPVEDPPHTTCAASSLMYYSAGCNLLRPLQIETAREVASVAPGAIVNGTVNPGDGRVDYGVDTCAGVSARILLEGAGISQTPSGSTSQFYHAIPGATPQGAQAEYAAFSDLDDDPATGCAPALLGFPTAFQGAELVTSAIVENVMSMMRQPSLPRPPPTQMVTSSVWRCVGGAFELLSDPRIQVSVDQKSLRGAIDPMEQLLAVEVPNDLRGPVGSQVRLQTLARDLGSSGTIERTPEDDAGAIAYLVAPHPPECALSRILVNPGGQTSASASGLRPNAAVDAYLGGDLVGHGATDPSGNVQLDVFVPANSPQGVRSLLLVNVQSAVSAACPLLIGGDAVTPATTATLTPAPSGSGWNNSTVTVALSAVDVPGGPGIRQIDYSAAGAETIPPTSAHAAATSFPISVEGTTHITYGATNNDSVSEHPRTVTVQLDTTLPSITGSRTPPANAYGWNNSDVTVAFTCSDALSGLLSCTDPTVLSDEGADQSVTGSAQDLALNTASATVDGISIDKTPPTVEYLGNLGTYTVDLFVSIQCSASDALSGIASNTCADITGPAYSFGLGPHAYSATAVDKADNATIASVTFEVRVTYPSLCNLGRQFASRPGVANGLCAKLSAAQAADARGNANAKAGAMRAYRHQVAAQTHKSLTSSEADVLTELSLALEAAAIRSVDHGVSVTR